MAITAPITIYNASAGSGKTYSLVKAYVSALLLSKDPLKHRHLLAITFTNKAVKEMKERVLDTLRLFAVHTTEKEKTPSMLSAIAEESGLSLDDIARKSDLVLKTILHNYAAFDIVTIDTLTHRVLRTFSRDLNIASNFEVSLDVKGMQAMAVDALIAKAGTDARITQVLVDFALQKADEDKDWNITRDLNEIAKLLSNENDAQAVTLLNDKTLEDFEALKKRMKQMRSGLIEHLSKEATQQLELIHSKGLEETHFTGKHFYNHVLKLVEDPTKADFKAKWKQEIENYSFYKKAEDDTIKAIIDSCKEDFVLFFNQTKVQFYELACIREFEKRITPLSVLQSIFKELEYIKQEENTLLISDFNDIIYTSLKEQPAAFIYERLGERYSNYFIDEFQDTSVRQWTNLIPLIDNALSSESTDSVANSLLLVGDPKQAIYRWRGGQAEQFIGLSKEKHPFAVEAIHFEQLDTNYRSTKEIISFNNSFFTYLSGFFDNPEYGSIYKNDNQQGINHRDGGYVSVDFIEADTVTQADEIYPSKVFEIIQEVTSQGFAKNDICILTRSNKHGAHIAQYLTEQDIQVVSPDSLLINNAPVVQFINTILELLVYPNTPKLMLGAISFIAEKLDTPDVHTFYNSWVKESTESFYKSLEAHNICFSEDTFNSLPLYEGVEYLIRAFCLNDQADAYVFAFLEAVFTYTSKNNAGLIGFLDYWEQKKNSLSIDAPLQKEAVQLMSIHKSKGLEFPVVIFPYADSDIYNTRSEHHWYATNPDDFSGFSSLMIGHSSSLENYGEQGKALYTGRKSQQQFDAINLLYVAMTRAVERLYVVSRFRESDTPKNFSELFVNYLKSNEKWTPGEMQYRFGESDVKKEDAEVVEAVVKIPFISSNKENHNVQVIRNAAFLWDHNRQDAITYGNLIHEIMSKIKTREDITYAISESVQEGIIPQEDKEPVGLVLRNVMSHPDLNLCFNKENKVYNERPILSQEGQLFIPDRLEITPEGAAIVIDYKTGIPLETHGYQMDKYASLLSEMGYAVTHKFLIYINEEVTVLNV